MAHYFKITLFCFVALFFFSSSILKSHSADHFFEQTGISKNFTVTNKPAQLNKTDNREHLNCLRNISELVLFYVAKVPKNYGPLDLRAASVLDKNRFSCLRKTSQELGLSYEFIRLNILSSKSHPPTFLY